MLSSRDILVSRPYFNYMNIQLRTLFCLMIVLLSGCGSSGPAKQGLVFEPSSFSTASNTLSEDDDTDDVTTPATHSKPTSCGIILEGISDRRHNKNSFGSSWNFEEFAKHVPQWIKTGLSNLETTNIRPSSNENHISMRVDILKAYTHLRATAKNANLVLRVHFSQPDKQDFSKIYRGTDTSINWNTSPEEIESAMNSAFSIILNDISTDLTTSCLANT